jgi:hypothetical protein
MTKKNSSSEGMEYVNYCNLTKFVMTQNVLLSNERVTDMIIIFPIFSD